MTRNLMLTLTLTITISITFAQTRIFDKDIEYGYGINSATGLDTRQALTYNYSPTEIAKSSTGQTISFHAIEIKTRNELIQSLATSLSIGGKGSYGAFSASASYKRETFNKLTINDYSQYLLINVTVRNPDKYIQDPILSDVAKSIARDFPNIFLSNFGDEFVFKKIYGGELYILFEFQSHSQVEYDRTKTAITAAASYFTAQGNISYTSEYIKQQLSLLTNKKIWLIREGGLKSIPQTEIDQLLKYARVDFIADIATNPLVLGVETKSFKNQFFVETDNVDFKKIRDIQRSMLDAAFEQKNLIYQNIANANYVLENINLFNIKEVKNYIFDNELDSFIVTKSAAFSINSSAINEISDSISIDEESDNELMLDEANGQIFDYQGTVKKYIATGEKLIKSIDDFIETCSYDHNNCSGFALANYKLKSFVPPLRYRYTRNALVKEKEVKTEVRMDDGYYVNNDSAYTNIGTCDYYSIAYISIRGEMKYRLNQKIDIYDGKFITVEFLDNKGAIIHSVPVESGKEIKWVPGTKARVKWKFYSVEWRKYKKAYIEKLRVTAVTF